MPSLVPKGPVIGPMIIAGVVDTEQSEVSYREMGCKDSKALTPKRREELAVKVRKTAKEIAVIEVPASEIDSLRKVISLNEVEAKKIAELIMSLKTKPDKIIIDCPDTDPKKFINRLRKFLGPDFNAIVEHRADVNYPICSAASIIAKDEREKWVEKIKKKYGDIGSGYPADPLTQEFLGKYLEERGKFPAFVRKSWDTSKRLLEKRLQFTLSGY